MLIIASFDKGLFRESDLSLKNCVVRSVLEMITIVCEFSLSNLNEKVEDFFVCYSEDGT